MSIDGFCAVLTAFQTAQKVPFRHYTYTDPVLAPCIAWYEMDGESAHADGINAYDEVYVRVELYVTPADVATAPAFEAALTENGLSYERDRAWVDERGEVMMIYDITL